jgi:hypothetical protein
MDLDLWRQPAHFNVQCTKYGTGWRTALSRKKIPLIFFRTLAGSEPVREWLKELPEEDRQPIGKDLLRAQWRWPGSGLWAIPSVQAHDQLQTGSIDENVKQAGFS